jgi:signal transduction histidine kinase
MIGDWFLSDAQRRWLLVAIAAVVAVVEARAWHPVQQWGLVAVLVVWLAWVGVWILGSVRPHWAWTALLAAGAIALEFLGHSAVVVTAMFIAVLQAGIRLQPRYGLPIAGTTIAVFVAVDAARSAYQDPLSVALNVVAFSALYAAALAFQQLREEQARTKQALEELRLSRAAQLESAKVEERARLAREIHDVLAHTLSALAVQLESARLLLEQRPGDPAALQAVDRAHRLAQDGLVEARRAVGTLRGGMLPGPEALRTLAADFEGDTGVPCRVEVEGCPPSSPPRRAWPSTAPPRRRWPTSASTPGPAPFGCGCAGAQTAPS